MTIHRTGRKTGVADTLAFGALSISTSTAQRWLYPGPNDAATAHGSNKSPHVAGRDGVITAIRAKHVVAGSGTADIIYTVEINDEDAFSVTIDNESTDVAEAFGSVNVSAGDEIIVRVNKSAAVAGSPLLCNVYVTLE